MKALALLLTLMVSAAMLFLDHIADQRKLSIDTLKLELALAKTENRALAQKLAACQNPPVEREPRPILNF